GFDLVVGQDAKGMAHHRRAGDFTERADMRQARCAVPGFENDFVLGPPLERRDDLARIFERPSVGELSEFAERGTGGVDRRHGFWLTPRRQSEWLAANCLRTSESGH